MGKEIPILFSTAMVQAILSGNKTQTRRVVKPQPFYSEMFGDYRMFVSHKERRLMYPEGDLISPELCPYGKPGDLLYVRETFTKLVPEHYLPDNRKYAYKADVFANDSEEYRKDYIKCGYPYQWRPSIHMPKEAARIWLQVKTVRVERLHDITPDDADLEGIEKWNEDYVTEPGALHADYKNYLWVDNEESTEYNFPSFPNPIDSFKSLWQSINGRESWDNNPWVWVVEFEVLSTTGKPEKL